jgi:hypothetical protein
MSRMKKWIIIILSGSLLLFLAGRTFFVKINSIETERQWYIDHLDFEFSFQVDSVVANEKGSGYLTCHLISGELDYSKEPSLNKQLTHYKQIKFLRYRADKRCDIIYRKANHSLAGDSIQINSSSNQVLFFRNGETIGKARIGNFLRERLF